MFWLNFFITKHLTYHIFTSQSQRLAVLRITIIFETLLYIQLLADVFIFYHYFVILKPYYILYSVNCIEGFHIFYLFSWHQALFGPLFILLPVNVWFYDIYNPFYVDLQYIHCIVCSCLVTNVFWIVSEPIWWYLLSSIVIYLTFQSLEILHVNL